jgi:uncharacterized protein (DUF1778 family)
LLPDLDAHLMRVIPGPDAGGGVCDGYTIELIAGDRSHRKSFTNQSTQRIATRKMLELAEVEGNDISLDTQFNFYVTTVPVADDQAADMPINIRSHCRPLMLEAASLADYQAHSVALQGASEPPPRPNQPPIPIFVTKDAWEESKRQAFRGGENESAAVFCAMAHRDTESPEIFMRLTACLEAAHAIEQQRSVELTGQSWANILERLDFRRRHLNQPQEILAGSVHRHPMLPSADSNGNRKCEACSIAKYCSRTTAVPSTADFEWQRSIFSGQPHGNFLLIWGYTAREEEDCRVYGLEDASFKERTIRLLTKDF